MPDSYGAEIKRLREAREWSQQELAARAQVGRELVVRAEQSGNVGVLMLYRIAHALDVDISAFFGGGRRRAEKRPSVWSRLKREQRAEVVRYAYRLLGERVPPEEMR